MNNQKIFKLLIFTLLITFITAQNSFGDDSRGGKVVDCPPELQQQAKTRSFDFFEWLSAGISKLIPWKIKLSDFSTDGCSSFPEGTLKEPNLWLHCCFVHDIAYYVGGERKRRLAADKALNLCVTKASGKSLEELLGIKKKKQKENSHPNPLGEMMEAGVYVGGSAFLPTTWRWAYGFSAGKNYQPLSNEEKQELRKRITTYFQQHCQNDPDLAKMAAREKDDVKAQAVIDRACDKSKVDDYLKLID